LNPHGREISPNRGNHEVRLAGFCPCVHAVRALSFGCDRVFLWLKRRILSTAAGSPVSLRWGAQNEHPGRAPACRVRLPEVAALLASLPHEPNRVSCHWKAVAIWVPGSRGSALLPPTDRATCNLGRFLAPPARAASTCSDGSLGSSSCPGASIVVATTAKKLHLSRAGTPHMPN
jgi:hypothetical protein